MCEYKFPTIYNIKNELLKEEANNNYDIVSRILNETSPNIRKELSILWREYNENGERYEIISNCGLTLKNGAEEKEKTTTILTNKC